ncbi:hypothetical protein [Hallella sp.]|uniref:hypothetical protein n=1 Tax=Hallella sp. TaxID=2980186 RepID=UPI00307DDE1C
MTREQLKNIMPIMTAYIEGKTIQCYDHNTGEWMDEGEQLHTADLFVWPSDFRIKPEPHYRPFKDGAECWEAVQKQEAFGWVKLKIDPLNMTIGIAEVNECNMFLSGSRSEEPLDYKQAFDVLTFLDGTPFGMKEE